MKAKEYINKYKPLFEACASVDEPACELFKELVLESNDLVQRRGAKRNSAVVAILKELDVKWHIIAAAFPDIYKPSGWKDYWHKEIPELKRLWP